jgi:hypothetical protein
VADLDPETRAIGEIAAVVTGGNEFQATALKWRSWAWHVNPTMTVP